MIAIDKAGTFPPVKDRTSYPFNQMDVGDSFLLTEQKKQSQQELLLCFSPVVNRWSGSSASEKLQTVGVFLE